MCDAPPVLVGAWRIDPRPRTATNGSTIRHLSPRATKVLLVLSEAGGDVVTRAELLRRVWAGVTVGDESLTQAISELRRALHDPSAPHPIIKTIPKAGYRVTADVVRDADERAPAGPRVAETFSMEAYLLCLEARQEMIRGGADGLELASALAREAANLAPQCALALSERAIALANIGLFRADRLDALTDAVAMAEGAVALRPDLSYTHAAYGFALGALAQDRPARTAFSQAFSNDPNDAEAHYLAARTFFVGRDYRTAMILAERAADLSDDGSRSLFMAARAAFAFENGRHQELGLKANIRIDAAANENAVPGTRTRFSQAKAPVLALLCACDDARQALLAHPKDGNTLRYYAVLARTLLGDIPEAVLLLEETIDNGWRDGRYLAAEPILKRLASEPRFQSITKNLAAA
ncbi:MAG: winged helix-turn-helix domain-containing protein [Pseudomonadota bacterium]